MKTNATMNGALFYAVDEAVHGALSRSNQTMHEAVFRAVNGAVHAAVFWAVDEAMHRAVHDELLHPTLDDFLMGPP